jgi:hypothetical protein
MFFLSRDQSKVLHAVTSSSPLYEQHFSEEQLHCFAFFLGDQRYGELVDHGFSILTPEEEAEITPCWNTVAPWPPEPSTEFANMDPQVADCWRGRIGNYRFNHIVGVGFEPTAVEYDKLNQCYSELEPPPDDGSDGTTGGSDADDNSSTTPTYSTYGERFPSSSPKRSCVKTALGSDFSWFNNTANPGATGEYERFHKLESKAAECFKNYPPPTSTYEPKYFMSPEMVTCLKNAVGEARFKEISSGASDITPIEREKGQVCFEKFYDQERPKVEYQSSAVLDKNTASCLKIAVGEKRYNQISAGTSTPTPEESAKGRECFGASSSPFAPPPVLKVDTTIKKCVAGSVDKNRLAKIKAGEEEPTEAERNKVSACFSKINKVQLAFLPLPPDQIPFLKVDTSVASISGVKTTYKKDKSGKEKPVVTYNGKGPANKTVDLYFFSDPVVVTVETDANGVWTYNLDVPLDSGDHVAYVAARTEVGEAVRSDVFRFSVAQAAASGDREGGLIVQSTSFRDQVSGYLYWVVGLVVVGVAGLLAIVIYRNRRKSKQEANLQAAAQP